MDGSVKYDLRTPNSLEVPLLFPSSRKNYRKREQDSILAASLSHCSVQVEIWTYLCVLT